MTINEIMQDCPEKKGRILLISYQSKRRLGRTFFIPWWYSQKMDCWLGTKRWYGKNNKSPLRIEYIPGGLDEWIISREKFPILPYNHPVRIKLEKQILNLKGEIE